MARLTRSESRVLRMIRRGPEISRDRSQAHIFVLSHPDLKTVRTTELLICRLQHQRLIAPSKNMLKLELTQEGFTQLDGDPHEGKSSLPPELLRFKRSKAMARVHEMRMEGFADPVDMLLMIACETNEEGEWKHPMDVRLQALAGAAPYCRPKLQAIIAKVTGGTKSHADWLKDLKEEMEGGGSEIIEGKASQQ